MAPVVRFIDTTVLCNLVPVPGRDADRTEVLAQLARYRSLRDVLVLPVTSVIETGNFVAQLHGAHRRATAGRLSAHLQMAVDGRAPYAFHDFAWSPAFVQRVVDGAAIGRRFEDLVSEGLGAGDQLILAEVASYRERSLLPVTVWTRDHQLSSYG